MLVPVEETDETVAERACEAPFKSTVTEVKPATKSDPVMVINEPDNSK